MIKGVLGKLIAPFIWIQKSIPCRQSLAIERKGLELTCSILDTMQKLTFFLFLLLARSCFGQNPQLVFRFAMKLGNLVTYERSQGVYGRLDGTGLSRAYSLSFTHIVPSFLWRGKWGLINDMSIYQANFKYGRNIG